MSKRTENQIVNASTTYTIKLLMYSRVHNIPISPFVRTVHNLPVYCTLMYTELAFENSSIHKTSALTSNRISRFYESNGLVSDSESNYQTNRKIHFTLQLFGLKLY